MDIPIEDAVTVAYVDVVHALNELKEALEANHQGFFSSADLGMEEAMEDLTNALEVLRPHVNKENQKPRYPTLAEHTHMEVGCWCG